MEAIAYTVLGIKVLRGLRTAEKIGPKWAAPVQGPRIVKIVREKCGPYRSMYGAGFALANRLGNLKHRLDVYKFRHGCLKGTWWEKDVPEAASLASRLPHFFRLQWPA